MQIGEGKQVRNEQEGLPENLTFNCTPENYKKGNNSKIKKN